MPVPTDHRPSCRRRVAPVGWHRPKRALTLGALAAPALLVAACGTTPAPVILNTEKVERAIERSSLAQRNKRVTVSCPAGVHQTKGLVFFCTASFRGGTTRFTVTELDGAGNVHYVAR